jgi:hypothetical protein
MVYAPPADEVTIEYQEEQLVWSERNGEYAGPLTVEEVHGDLLHITHEHWNAQAGFDLTKFSTVEDFVGVLEDVELDPIDDFVRVKGSVNEEDTYLLFVWANYDGMILTGCNPITGEMRDGKIKKKGYASYIGIEGTGPFVSRIYDAICNSDSNIKDRVIGVRSFI